MNSDNKSTRIEEQVNSFLVRKEFGIKIFKKKDFNKAQLIFSRLIASLIECLGIILNKNQNNIHHKDFQMINSIIIDVGLNLIFTHIKMGERTKKTGETMWRELLKKENREGYEKVSPNVLTSDKYKISYQFGSIVCNELIYQYFKECDDKENKKSKLAKIYYRRGICYRGMGYIYKAYKSFERSFEEFKDHQDKKMTEMIKKEMSECKVLFENNREKDEEECRKKVFTLPQLEGFTITETMKQNWLRGLKDDFRMKWFNEPLFMSCVDPPGFLENDYPLNNEKEEKDAILLYQLTCGLKDTVRDTKLKEICEKEITKIGEKLYLKDSPLKKQFKMFRMVYRTNGFSHKECAKSTIDRLWDGIGDWRW